MSVVVQRAKLGRELRHDRRDEGRRQREDHPRVEQRVETAVNRYAELAARDRVRDETTDVEHHACGKNEQTLLEHRARAKALESTPQHQRARWTHASVHSTLVLMEIEHLPLTGALVLTPRIFGDERGYFAETYSLDRYRQCGVEETFVQDNLSLSRRNVLRGLHGDERMAKLVGVVRGSIFDVIVDYRASSPTRRRWHGMVLDAAQGRQIYVPKGFLH